MKISYGIVALNNKDEMLHFIGYEYIPQQVDFESVREELENEEEFGLFDTEFRLEFASTDDIRAINAEMRRAELSTIH